LAARSDWRPSRLVSRSISWEPDKADWFSPASMLDWFCGVMVPDLEIVIMYIKLKAVNQTTGKIKEFHPIQDKT